MATRWGICGPGEIAHDFCLCLKSLPADEHQIVAVASRDKGRAQKFGSKFDIPAIYGCYSGMAEDPNIDIVYVATIHVSHVETSLLFINAGKNVLCEKTMALSLDGCKRVLSAAREKNVFFMEGYWTRHLPAYRYVMDSCLSPDSALGEVMLVQASFTISGQWFNRAPTLDLGGGGLMAFGCYAVMAANMFFKGKPTKISAQGNLTENGVDRSAAITLSYPGNKMAVLVYHTEAHGGLCSLVIRGTKGNIVIPDTFWAPDRIIMEDQQEKCFQFPKVPGSENFNFVNCEGLVYEAEAVRDCIQKGFKEHPLMTLQDSEDIMAIQSEVLQQLGVKYSFP